MSQAIFLVLRGNDESNKKVTFTMCPIFRFKNKTSSWGKILTYILVLEGDLTKTGGENKNIQLCLRYFCCLSLSCMDSEFASQNIFEEEEDYLFGSF